jgi:hypothetical protein
MKGEQKTIPFEEFATNLETILDQVEREGGEITVARGNAQFVVRRKARRSSGRKSHRITADDPLWDIVGIGRTEGPTDVSSNKYKYVADAIASHFQEPREQAHRSTTESSEAPPSPPVPASPDEP